MRKIYSSVFFVLFISVCADAQFATVGNASLISGSEYQLTPQLRDQRGAIWNTTTINLTQDFIARVSLNFGIISEANPADGAPDFRTGADGIAFVFQPNGTAAIGGLGAEIGYGGIANSFAFEFDTWRNTPAWVTGSYEHFEPVNDHVAFMSEGSTTHTSANDLGTYPLPNGVEIEDGAWHDATFMWNATAKALTVTFLGTTYTYNGDIAAITGTNSVNWGFTSATGLGVNDHRVRILSRGCGQVIPCGNKNDPDKKVMVCHIPPGQAGGGAGAGKTLVLCVSWDAVPAHLAHGDCLGDCSGGVHRIAPRHVEEEEHALIQQSPSVFPNPSRGQVQVNLGTVDPKAQIMIINSRGVTVETRSGTNSQNLSFNLKKYGVGVYLVKVVSGGTVQTTKVIVQD